MAQASPRCHDTNTHHWEVLSAAHEHGIKCAKGGPRGCAIARPVWPPAPMIVAAQSKSWGHLLWRDLPVDYCWGGQHFAPLQSIFVFPCACGTRKSATIGHGIDGRWNRAKTPFRTGQFGSGMSRFDSLSSGHLISAPAGLPPFDYAFPAHTPSPEASILYIVSNGFISFDPIDHISTSVAEIWTRLEYRKYLTAQAPKWSFESSSCFLRTDPTQAPFGPLSHVETYLIAVSLHQCRTVRSTGPGHATCRIRLMDPTQRNFEPNSKPAETLRYCKTDWRAWDVYFKQRTAEGPWLMMGAVPISIHGPSGRR